MNVAARSTVQRRLDSFWEAAFETEKLRAQGE